MRSEQARLHALHQLRLLDTPPSESFDRITRMAAQIFDLPIAAISLTDSDRQWFKSRVGVTHNSIPRAGAPCAQVAELTETLVISDLTEDPDYATSPLAARGMRFYAGVPLITPAGHGLGALCVLGTAPRTVTGPEMRALTDLASMVMAQIELQHAFGRVDAISGLPNRKQLIEDLDDLGREAPGRRRLLVLVDIARDDQLNQGRRVMGPAFIDDIVSEAARTLHLTLGKDRTAYHVGTTQFAFLAPAGVEDQPYVLFLGSRLNAIRSTARARFVMTAAIGVAPFVGGQTRAQDALRAAFGAAQDARLANVPVCLHSAANDGAQARRFELLHAFEAALSTTNQLRLVIQPRIDLVSGRCLGGEALLRWCHPTLGEVSPNEFIPIVERTAIVRQVTYWVLDAAIAQLALWAKAGIDLDLSVNISASNLEEVDFAARVQLLLLKYRVRPDRLELELTESAVMENAELALVQLEELAEHGVRLAIDDFGTGYSSLAYLQRLPAKIVKIDKSFVHALAEGAQCDCMLVRSMIGLSHGLGYRVVAEGVETQATADLLLEMGCEEAQGYFFARPLEAEDFPAWLDVYEARDDTSEVA
ncbi:putative bifunctional diguanylate cyclase/phosphodiesterase [Sphingomonas sp. PB4P5]|uniref:putative bifunctional diguanylate cyclase/phosphodiesterase n=1 Tax=Parasphingomonas puruogangriensis TaxID=3096155 RepID=UPI002FC87BE8